MNYNLLPRSEIVEKTTQALEGKGYVVLSAANKKEALKKIIEIIPEGSSVMNGSSTTLKQIGYNSYLETNSHKWADLHAKINTENDEARRHELRKQSMLSDYYLGSVHALIENGEFIIASNTGTQLPHVVYTSPNLIFVVSTKKIVSNLDKAIKRLEKHVIPLENQRMMDTYKMPTTFNKLLIFKGESPFNQRKITFILVNEDLGF